MSIKKNGVVVFIISFLASIVILGVGFLAVSFFTKSTDVKSEKKDVEYIEKNPSKASHRISFLVFGTNKDENDLGLCFLVDYVPTEDRYTLALLQPALLLGDYTISEKFSKDVLFAKMQIEEILEKTIDEYIVITKKEMVKVIDFLGGITFDVEQDKSLNGQKILKGKQLLDGRRVVELLLEDYDGLYNVEAQYNLINEVIKQRFNIEITSKLEVLFDLLFSFKTTFNRYDILSRDSAFQYTLNSDNIKANDIIVEGVYNNSITGLEPDKEQIKKLKQVIT